MKFLISVFLTLAAAGCATTAEVQLISDRLSAVESQQEINTVKIGAVATAQMIQGIKAGCMHDVLALQFFEDTGSPDGLRFSSQVEACENKRGQDETD